MIPFRRGSRIGVIGAGRSGLAAARLLKRSGARVLLSDNGRLARAPRGVDVEQGGHSARLLACDGLIRSPGVPDHLPILRRARQRNIPIWSELELAWRHICRPARILAITGTNGKTTTTSLIGAMCRAAKKSTLLGGNIGTPLSDLAGRVRPSTWLVLEVSSYQLENSETFHPTVAVLLNIAPDHLDHHRSMRAYAEAKARIFKNQNSDDTTVYNADDPGCRRLARRSPARLLAFSRRRLLARGVSYHQGRVYVRWGTIRSRWPLTLQIPGLHNIENALAAIGAGVAAGLPARAIRSALKRFPGVEHRLEWVRTVAGVRYINDSKGTNVDSTRVALESLPGPLVVILGGQGKGSPYAPLAPLIKAKARRLLLIGQDAPRIRRELGAAAPAEIVETMARAVPRARAIAAAGDVVLLSPACASFDQYANYEERGRDFKACVRRL